MAAASLVLLLFGLMDFPSLFLQALMSLLGSGQLNSLGRRPALTLASIQHRASNHQKPARWLVGEDWRNEAWPARV